MMSGSKARLSFQANRPATGPNGLRKEEKVIFGGGLTTTMSLTCHAKLSP